jgi:NitT/TauT family transport system permease protein
MAKASSVSIENQRRRIWAHSFERHERLLFGAAGLMTLLLAWELGNRLGYLRTLFFSSPSLVLQAAVDQFGSGKIWPHIWTSASELVVGLAVASVVGVVIGLCAGWFEHANWLLDPWFTVLYSTPKVAIIPLIILLLGIDFQAKVFIVAFISLMTIVINSMAGAQQSKGPLLDVAKSFGASQTMQWRAVVLPGSAPYILTGIGLAVGHGMVGVIVAELVAGNEGLGYVIKYAGHTLQSSTLILGIVLIGLWGVTVGEVMRRVERRVERWRPPR